MLKFFHEWIKQWIRKSSPRLSPGIKFFQSPLVLRTFVWRELRNESLAYVITNSSTLYGARRFVIDVVRIR
jgi:hypothetical protein